MSAAFRTAGPFGFYPIVATAAEVHALLDLGVRTVQLRAKGLPDAALRSEVAAALDHGHAHDAQVVINDHWRLAIELGASWIHLGQEDLDTADLRAIRASGAGLGLSSHSPGERDRAVDAGAAYIALGPVFETTLKAMAFAPQGLDRLRAWKAHLGSIPLVAIGGIRLHDAAALRAAGADSVAMVSDVQGPHRAERVRAWLDEMSAPLTCGPLPSPQPPPHTALYALRRASGGTDERALRRRLREGGGAWLGRRDAGRRVQLATELGGRLSLDGEPAAAVPWRPEHPIPEGALLRVRGILDVPEARALCEAAAVAGASLVIDKEAAMLARVAASFDVAAIPC